MLTRRHFLLAPAAAVVACGPRRSSGYDGYAFVANHDGQALAVVDLATFTLARHVPMEGNPTAVAAPGNAPAVYALTAADGHLHEVTTANLSVKRRIAVARSCVSMRVSPDGDALWLLCRQPRLLIRVPLRSFRPERPIGLPLDPVDFDLSSDGRRAAVCFAGSDRFGLVDVVNRSCQLFDGGRNLSLVRFRSDDRQILLAAADEPLLTVADAKSGRVVVHLPLAVRAQHLCLKSDGGQLFISGTGMDAVVVVYPFTTEVAGTALAGRAPGVMAECDTDDIDFLFVANPFSGEVTILDIDRRKVIAVVAVGRNPSSIIPTPDKRYILVLNEDSGDMAVIRTAAIAAKRDRSAPLFTMVPLGSRPVAGAVRHA